MRFKRKILDFTRIFSVKCVSRGDSGDRIGAEVGWVIYSGQRERGRTPSFATYSAKATKVRKATAGMIDPRFRGVWGQDVPTTAWDKMSQPRFWILDSGFFGADSLLRQGYGGQGRSALHFFLALWDGLFFRGVGGRRRAATRHIHGRGRLGEAVPARGARCRPWSEWPGMANDHCIVVAEWRISRERRGVCQ
jgi:hypothetical protein